MPVLVHMKEISKSILCLEITVHHDGGEFTPFICMEEQVRRCSPVIEMKVDNEGDELGWKSSKDARFARMIERVLRNGG